MISWNCLPVGTEQFDLYKFQSRYESLHLKVSSHGSSKTDAKCLSASLNIYIYIYIQLYIYIYEDFRSHQTELMVRVSAKPTN